MPHEKENGAFRATSELASTFSGVHQKKEYDKQVVAMKKIERRGTDDGKLPILNLGTVTFPS